jgi:4,5-dihydroxyphthalate decarboxylase
MDNMPIPDRFTVDWSCKGEEAAELFREGKIDAYLSGRIEQGEGVRCLFPDALEEQVRFYRERGFVPTMHVVAVKQDVAEKHPEIVQGLIDLWTEARDRAFKRAGANVVLVLPFAELHLLEMQRLFGKKTWNEYGWAPNEAPLRAFFHTAREQGLIQSDLVPEDCFLGV